MNVILEGVVGSIAYGLATPSSDVDRLGVFCAPMDDVLGLDGPRVVEQSVVSHDPDRTVHELGKFCRLALACNPTVMELLWLNAYDTDLLGAEALGRLRTAALGADQIRATYGGYATAQARKVLDRHRQGRDGFASDLAKRTEKHGRHCWRLLVTGQRLLTTGELVLDVSDRRDEMFEMGRLALADPEAFNERFATQRASLDDVPTSLPAEPDRAVVNGFLVNLRRRTAADAASSICA